MRNYLVLTAVRGLPRLDKSREPVDAGEIITLPSAKATELGVIGAVEPSEAEATVLLDWPDMPGAIVQVWGDGAIRADRDGLVAAIGALGGIVFFVGEGLPDQAEDVLADFSNEQLLDELDYRVEDGRLHPSMIRPRYEAERSVAPASSSEVPATVPPAVASEAVYQDGAPIDQLRPSEAGIEGGGDVAPRAAGEAEEAPVAIAPEERAKVDEGVAPAKPARKPKATAK